MTAANREDIDHGGRLLLFVTGEAPRSRRARTNLRNVLKARGGDPDQVVEIDLLRQPERAIRHRMFATPALLRTDAAGTESVLYGDLSDSVRLHRFLDDLPDEET